MVSVRVGPAGWSYKDWNGVVYPKPAPRGFDPLAYLAQYFDALEINSTFYRPQPAPVTHAWVERVAHNPRFRFTAKLLRRFTQRTQSSGVILEVRKRRHHAKKPTKAKLHTSAVHRLKAKVKREYLEKIGMMPEEKKKFGRR